MAKRISHQKTHKIVHDLAKTGGAKLFHPDGIFFFFVNYY